MSVIIRLQGLPWTANALDIRQYFDGLTIPEGGVHIVGGDDGDAFIAFSSDEDARQAMLMDGGSIKESSSKVKLMLSSRTEMQKVIEAARNRNLIMQGILAAGALNVNQMTMATSATAASSTTGMTGQQQLQQVTSELSIQQQLFMSRAAAAAAAAAAMMPTAAGGHQAQPFQLQQLNAMQEMLQGDMRQFMMQNMGLQPGLALGASQSVLPNAGNLAMGTGTSPLTVVSSPSYEPTKTIQITDERGPQQQQQRIVDRDSRADVTPTTSALAPSRERDRDRDRRDRDSRLNRRNSRSRSPRRRSRDRDRDTGSSRRRDRRRSTSRGRSREKSNDRSRSSLTSLSSTTANKMNVEPSKRGATSTGEINNVPVNGDNSKRRGGRWDNGGVPPLINLDSDDGQQQVGDAPPWIDRGPPPRGRNGGGGDLSDPKVSMCIVIRGIPYDTHPMSIREYFNGLSIAPDGIRLLIDTIGNRPHLAFVRFSNEFDRDIVLKRQSHFFQGLMVEVFPCAEEEFQRIPCGAPTDDDGGVGGFGEINVWSRDNPNQRRPINGQRPQRIDGEEENCLFIRGIPFRCTEKDIYEFFDGFKIVDALIEYLRPGKSSGTGFAEFESAMEANRALELDGQKMEFRNVDIRMSTKKSMMTAKRQTHRNCNSREPGSQYPGGRPFDGQTFEQQGPHPPPMIMSSSNPAPFSSGIPSLFGENFVCCLITGLPLSATDRDILDFFAPANISPVVIHVMLDTGGRPMGDAFCEFSNPRDCHQAVQMSGMSLRPQQMNRFRLNIRPVSRMELEAALGAIQLNLRPDSQQPSSNNNNNNSVGSRLNVTGGGGPVPLPLVSNNASTPASKQSNLPNNNQNSPHKPNSTSGEMKNSNDRTPTKPSEVMPLISGSTDTKQHEDQQQKPGPNMNQTQRQLQKYHPMMNQQHHPAMRPPRMGPRFLGRPTEPGCVVEVQNLPYLSTTEEILDHFKGYGLTRENIMRRFRENGAPTGDARLLFRSSKDAQMAYRELNSVMMGGRVLNLKLLP